MAKLELPCKEWQRKWIWLFPNAASSLGFEGGEGQMSVTSLVLGIIAQI